ncbi:hypothetical protein EV361DRAFT_936614 [Lentinula raphanica]|uniref:Uncharacterized protein n=1 Tax=Lentinula raphanica TaxID=153919 RepID=A0AA38PHY4_9AGAR|nr:hypothetical protein F5878DRAFT_337676 [Lentinula raphanica]KAJ3966134.1 hypothetical protein EV361DRAFT_936614 [Lentinula raphanica]
MQPTSIVRLLLATCLLLLISTQTTQALPSPSLDTDADEPRPRSTLQFRGRVYENARRDREFSSRDILFNKANDMRRAQRFRAAQKKKRTVGVDADAV